MTSKILRISITFLFLFTLSFSVFSEAKAETDDNVQFTRIKVADSDPGYSAKIISLRIPKKVVPGRSYKASVVFKNIGKKMWTAKRGYKLGVKDGNNSFGNKSIAITPNRAVGKARPYRFNFTLKIPKEPGQYNEQFQVSRGATTWFGETIAIKINTSNEDWNQEDLSDLRIETAQVFLANNEKGFSGAEVTIINEVTFADELKAYTIDLTKNKFWKENVAINRFRLDPIDTLGKVTINKIEFLRNGAVIKSFNKFDDWQPVFLERIDSNTFKTTQEDAYLLTTVDFNIKDANAIVVNMKVEDL